MAGETTTATKQEFSNGVVIYSITWTAASDDGAFADLVINGMEGYRLDSIKWLPPATGPLDNSDLGIVDAGNFGLNLVATNGLNAIDEADARVSIDPDDTGNIIMGSLTLSIANNNVNDVVLPMKLVFLNGY